MVSEKLIVEAVELVGIAIYSIFDFFGWFATEFWVNEDDKVNQV
jgi:hypothetical protein